MTAAWYGVAAGTSFLFPDAPGAHDLRVPLIGPWQAIVHNGCAADNPGCSRTWIVLRSIVTAIDGIGQGAGPLIVLEGLFLPTGSEAPKAEPSNPERPRPAPGTPNDGNKTLFSLPMPTLVGQAGIGVGISGQF